MVMGDARWLARRGDVQQAWFWEYSEMRRTFVAGNWKMNGTRDSATELVNGIKAGLAAGNATEVAVCPPYPYLSLVADLLDGTAIGLGAQNVAVETNGAYTGEVSGSMLKDVGCRFVIIGHSERRTLYGESDQRVADKFERLLSENLTPILCVGELLEERQSGATETVVARQLDAVIDKVGVAALARSIIAYEPVWAIGTGMTATPEQAQDVHAFIRGRIAALDATVAEGIRILYGGSVKGDNAAGLFGKPDIDGGLIGGAALKAADFLAICQAGG